MKTDRTSLLFVLGVAAITWVFHKAIGVAGVGKVERIKRRIYKEVSLAQSAGVDFSKKFDNLTEDEIVTLESVGSEAGWKQSKRSVESGKSYAEAYYNSLRRAWNAVSGIRGIGTAYNVKDANGRVVLTWIEDAQAHYEAERKLNDLEADLRKRRNAARRRQQRIDREGLPSVVQPTPAPAQTNEPERRALNEKRANEIDQARIALLEKSPHMDIFIRRKGEKMVHDAYAYGGGGYDYMVDDLELIKGDDRYNYLPYINYIVVVHTRNEYYGTTYVPVRAFNDKQPAREFAKKLTKAGKNAKAVFVTDVNVNAITGLSV